MRKLTLNILFILAATLFWQCSGEKKEDNKKEEDNKSEEVKKEEDIKEEDIKEDVKEESSESKENAEKALLSIKNYFANLTSGDYQKASESFASSVKQWITMKEVTPTDIAKEAKRFLSTKKNVKYQIAEYSFNYDKEKATIKVTQLWDGYEATLVILLAFDDAAKITSYIESKVIDYKVINPSATSLKAYMEASKKVSLPIKVHNNNEFKEMSAAQRKFLALQPSGVMLEHFYDFGYFEYGNNIGVIFAYQYTYHYQYEMIMFNKETGALVGKVPSLGFATATSGPYNYSFESMISETGLIEVKSKSNYLNSTEVEKVKYQIEEGGTIVKIDN